MSIVAAVILCIASVHDGDGLKSCQGEKIRISNIDAPELRGSPRCSPKRRRQLARTRNPAWCDYKLGVRSRDALRAFVVQGRVRMQRTGRRTYGRTLARVTVNGRDAGEYLISRGLARRWR